MPQLGDRISLMEDAINELRVHMSKLEVLTSIVEQLKKPQTLAAPVADALVDVPPNVAEIQQEIAPNVAEIQEDAQEVQAVQEATQEDAPAVQEDAQEVQAVQEATQEDAPAVQEVVQEVQEDAQEVQAVQEIAAPIAQVLEGVAQVQEGIAQIEEHVAQIQGHVHAQGENEIDAHAYALKSLAKFVRHHKKFLKEYLDDGDYVTDHHVLSLTYEVIWIINEELSRLV